MELLIGIVVMVAVILVFSKLGDIALEHGSLWLFLALTIIGSGLFLALRAAAIAAATRG